MGDWPSIIEAWMGFLVVCVGWGLIWKPQTWCQDLSSPWICDSFLKVFPSPPRGFSTSWNRGNCRSSHTSQYGFWQKKTAATQRLHLTQLYVGFVGFHGFGLQMLQGKRLDTTDDGRNPKQPPGMKRTKKNNGIICQPQLVIAGFLRIQHLSSEFWAWARRSDHFFLLF